MSATPSTYIGRHRTQAAMGKAVSELADMVARNRSARGDGELYTGRHRKPEAAPAYDWPDDDDYPGPNVNEHGWDYTPGRWPTGGHL